MLVAFTTISILVATLYPSKTSLSLNIWDYDKLGHFIMFAGWTFLVGLFRASNTKRKPSLWKVFSLGCFYGLMIEFLQFVVPTNRSPETLDFVADALGALFAIFVLHFLFKSMFSTDKANTA
ncbi:MAG: VanZ family protein [Balneola sp.]